VDKFLINRGLETERTVEGEEYATVGDFIDFYIRNGAKLHGRSQVLRIRADDVFTIDLVKDPS
jgi:hypothetical protein